MTGNNKVATAVRPGASPARTTTRRRVRRQWASGTDQLIAGFRYVALFGNLEIPARSVLDDALATITAAGPHTRVALTPKPGKRIWSLDSAVQVPVHQLPEAVAEQGDAAVMQYIRRRPEFKHPLEVHVCDRYIALDIDHGLGDLRFAIELILALYAHRRGSTSPWVANDDTPLALPRALFRMFAISPSRTRTMWKYATRLRSASTGDVATTGESVPWSPSSALTLVCVDADAESAVDEWRRANLEKSSSAAVWLFLVRQALHAAGLEMTDQVLVATDCRRYLLEKQRVNGNFMCGVNITLPVNESLSTVIKRMRELTTSAIPLAGLGAVSARALLSARRTVTTSSRQVGAPAQMMWSDAGLLTVLEGLPWVAGHERVATGLLDPAGPDSITVLNARIGDIRKVAISFHDNVFDRRVIERAAEYLKDPARFLASNVPQSP